MNYYIILLIVFFLITLSFNYMQPKHFIEKNKYYLIAIMILLTLFLILRDTSVGIDTDNYRNIFDYCRKLDFIELWSFERHEIGFKYYTKILSIFNSYYLYLSITSILSMIGAYFFIKDNSKNYFESLLIFIAFNFYGYYFGILRQVLALSFILYSIKYVKDRKLWKFLLFVFLAFLFHRTALIFIPVYFLYNIKLNKKLLICWGSLISVFLLFKKYILQIALQYLITPGALDGKAGNGYIMLIFLIGLSLVLYFYQDKLIKQDKNNQIFINMIFVACLIQTISTIYGNAYRLTLYYAFAIIPIIPNTILVIENKKIQIILRVLMILSLSLYFAYMTFKLINYVPYQFIF